MNRRGNHLLPTEAANIEKENIRSNNPREHHHVIEPRNTNNHHRRGGRRHAYRNHGRQRRLANPIPDDQLRCSDARKSDDDRRSLQHLHRLRREEAGRQNQVVPGLGLRRRRPGTDRRTPADGAYRRCRVRIRVAGLQRLHRAVGDHRRAGRHDRISVDPDGAHGQPLPGPARPEGKVDRLRRPQLHLGLYRAHGHADQGGHRSGQVFWQDLVLGRPRTECDRPTERHL